MGTLTALLQATAFSGPGLGGAVIVAPSRILLQEAGGPSVQGKERIVIRKDGGPGHGPDQPFCVREQGAADLEGFVGGKYVVFAGPWDVIVLALIVLLVVVLIIAL